MKIIENIIIPSRPMVQLLAGRLTRLTADQQAPGPIPGVTYLACVPRSVEQSFAHQQAKKNRCDAKAGP